MPKNIRVRFAPSPTGPLHIGGLRTALYNYLFAKKHGGDFVLRIEDTDQNRLVPGSEQYIISALDWCGLACDESPEKGGKYGPYRQSERKELYREYADRLVESGHAYHAFDTPGALDKTRQSFESRGETFMYNHITRSELDNAFTRPPEEVKNRIRAGEDYVIRFNPPADKTLVFDDLVRGNIRVATATLDDKVLFKSDGMPTYHLANVVDDRMMAITHVIRGEEWLPSTPLHVLLYEAFGWEKPQFAHLPLILKPTGKGKLSKRDGDKMGFPVFPLDWKTTSGEVYNGYREAGYLPEAVVNMLALLGWNPGTEQEFFPLEELIGTFDLGRIQKGGARFDPEKVRWFQHHYFQLQPDGVLAEKLQDIIAKREIKTSLDPKKVIPLVKERATFAEDLWEHSHFLFDAPETYDKKAAKKAWKSDSAGILENFATLLAQISFESQALKDRAGEFIKSRDISFGKLVQPLRLSLAGALKGPDLFEIMALIGKDETVSRIKHAIKLLSR